MLRNMRILKHLNLNMGFNKMSLQKLADKFWENINLEDVSLVGTILNSKETYNPDIVDRVRKIMKGNK